MDAYRGCPDSRVEVADGGLRGRDSRRSAVPRRCRAPASGSPRSTAPLVWPTGDVAFGERERRRWEEVFLDHRTEKLEVRVTASRRTQSRSSRRSASGV